MRPMCVTWCRCSCGRRRASFAGRKRLGYLEDHAIGDVDLAKPKIRAKQPTSATLGPGPKVPQSIGEVEGRFHSVSLDHLPNSAFPSSSMVMCRRFTAYHRPSSIP